MVEPDEKQLQDMFGMLRGLDDAASAQAQEKIREIHKILTVALDGLNERRASAKGKDEDISHADAIRTVQGLDRQAHTQRDRGEGWLRIELTSIGVLPGITNQICEYLHNITVGEDRGVY